MTPLILGVKAAALHFPSCRPIARYAATATKQIDRRAPATMVWSEALVEVLPRGHSHVRRGREIDDCFGTVGRRYRKKLSEPEQVRNRAPALVTKACSDETGMQAICGDARAVQPAGELTRK